MEAANVGIMGFEDILAATNVQYVEVDAWGKKTGLMSITAGEVLEWLEQKELPGQRKEAGLLLLARSFVTAEKSRLCDTPEKEQMMVGSLKLKDSKTVNTLTNRVLVLNGIIEETVAQAKND
jgi:hypothetical protein